MMNKRLILIEDDDLIRELYKDEFTAAGFTIEAYPNGQDGLEALEMHQYDLLLLDIMLPDTNGLEVLKKVKQLPNNKDILVVLLTNLGQDSIIKEGFKLGADAYLIKLAYNPDQIVKEVRDILEKKSPKS